MLQNLIEEHIWEIPGEVKVSGITLPCRSLVIQTAPGKLWMWSPVRMDAHTIEAVKELGEVEHLVAPSLMHHVFFGAAHEAFPTARTYGPARLRKKRPDLNFEDLSTGVFSEIGIECHRIEGMPAMDEWVFFHRETKTIIFTDLVFNLTGTLDFMTSMVTRGFGTYHRLAVSRLVKLAVKDRARAKKTMSEALDWPFERAIMAHGTPLLDSDGAKRVREPLSFFVS